MKIYAGVLCRVIGGTDNLNLDKIVRVVSNQGEHSILGRIWHCSVVEGFLITAYGGVGIAADFAQDWLEPLPPVVTPLKQVEELV